jgi:hypothetical protein
MLTKEPTMTNRTITDPAKIFRLFASEYRMCKPCVAVSAEFNKTIDTIIDDISEGREVAAFLSAEPFVERPPRKSETEGRCSKWFISFLEVLYDQMAQQEQFRVHPARAVELLYNFDYDDDDFTQPIMRLQYDPSVPLGFVFVGPRPGTLVSEPAYDERFGGRLVLHREAFSTADDWNLTPN